VEQVLSEDSTANNGDDTILARDGNMDTIDCGPGIDTVNGFDPGLDDPTPFNCELRRAKPLPR
jgi:hypothetical protein